uniref:Uncharacterized protein n=1 Tax=Aegilops tauschii subsp. strangulata TaxID=200361 RepID=A0A453GN61_AEGTS
MRVCMCVCSAEGERIPVQACGERDGRRLLLWWAGERGRRVRRRQSDGLRGDRGGRGEAPGAEHIGRLHVPHRLRALGRHEPASLAPARHRDPLRRRGNLAGGLRHDRRQAHHPGRAQGRGLRVPARHDALRAQRRRGARRGDLSVRQPAPRHAEARRGDVRGGAGGTDGRAGLGAADRRRCGGEHQGQVPAKVGHEHVGAPSVTRTLKECKKKLAYVI